LGVGFFISRRLIMEQFKLITEARDKIAEKWQKRGLQAAPEKSIKKKIIGLSMGRKNGNCETLLHAAALGAEEFGIDVEIIRAIELRIKPCVGCGSCTMALAQGKIAECSIKDDDVPWILEKTVLEDNGLILAVPVYHLRNSGAFMVIAERLHPTMFSHLEILKKNKVGGIISVGGSDWTQFGLSGANIWMLHHRRIVDQVQFNFGIRDKAAMERARELGRNVARSMSMPIEEVNFTGDRTAVECPVCHCNILQVNQDLPQVVCPVCFVHGVIAVDNGKMKINWKEEEIKKHRFSEYGVFEHLDLIIHNLNQVPSRQEIVKKLHKEYTSHATYLKPS
jgi:multimeric flavodoxin WrbA